MTLVEPMRSHAKYMRKKTLVSPFDLSMLEQQLNHQIRGQTAVLQRVNKAVLRRELQTFPQEGCRDAFFFAGPTGVGKTETARILSQFVFGLGKIIRFDCSEFKTLESIAALLGNRMGDQGRFSQAHVKVSEGVWLFDEVEKAHPEFVHLFLQMVSAARLTVANGETLDLSRIYIIVTSNLGSAEIIGREHLPFASLERHVIRCIQRHLRPELLARFGTPFVFRPLTREVQFQIVEFHMARLLGWLLVTGRSVSSSPEVVQYIFQHGFSSRLGARPLLKAIYELVGDALVENMMSGGSGSGQLVIASNKLRLVS